MLVVTGDLYKCKAKLKMENTLKVQMKMKYFKIWMNPNIHLITHFFKYNWKNLKVNNLRRSWIKKDFHERYEFYLNIMITKYLYVNVCIFPISSSMGQLEQNFA